MSTASAGLFLGDTSVSMKNLNFVGILTKPASDAIAGVTGLLPGFLSGIAQIIK